MAEQNQKSDILGRGEEFKSPEARFSYLQGMYQTNDQGKYTVTLIFDIKHKPALEAELFKVAKAAWGDKAAEMAKTGMIKSPLLAGDGKEARKKDTGEINPGLGPNVFFVRCSTKIEPTIRFRNQHEAPKLGSGGDDIKSGDYGFAVLAPYAYKHPQSGNGVSFGINYLQKTREGESLGGTGGVDVGKYFEKIEDAGAAPEETKGGAGASGLFG